MVLLYLFIGLQVLVVLFVAGFLIKKIRNHRRGKADDRNEF
jgi:hypothetical protein